MNKKRHPGRTIVALMVFLLLVFSISNYLIWKKNYYHRVYPGITLGDFDLSGLSFAEAKEIIAKQTKQIENNGITFKYNDKEIVLESVVSSFDSDLSAPTLFFDINETTARAFENKISQNFWDYLDHKLKSKEKRQITAVYTLDEKLIKELITENFPELEIPPINAQFSIVDNKEGEIKLKTSPERIGKEIDYEQIFFNLKNNLNLLKEEVIIIKTQTKYPEVKEADLSILEDEAEKVISKGNLSLIFGKKTWRIKPAKLITWFIAKKEKKKLILSLDSNKVKEYLEIEVAPEIDKEVIRPKFEIEDNKVTSWITGEDGRKLKIEESYLKITKELLVGERKISLEIEDITNDEYIPESGFQIKEIIGTGYSNFAGSPDNRRHNIKIGADSVHGILVKPDEEFSLVQTLGVIDETSDYLPELVIKGNETIPEYGGGLCQIGTTIFRTALASGLPITARRNHSYRVSYYEPAGTDAAVYDPWPDVKFMNDTGNYILIQARIEDRNDLYFDFWGIKDGRIATSTQPTIFNIVKPEPTKIVETTELPPGEKKCTEHSHNGADAYFDYIVTYPEGATTTPLKKEVRFTSHYVPWQEVCLLGVEATSTEKIATSTIEN